MTLNEAIRRGCLKFPKQAFNKFHGDDGLSACVIAAVYVGDNERRYTDREFHQSAYCPVGPCESFTDGLLVRSSSPDTVMRVMVHLNNDHRWSREAIAEWADPQPDLHVPMPTVKAPEAVVTHG